MVIPFKIGIASEGKAFRQGIDNDVIKPLDNAEDALKDLAKGGDKAGDQLEKSLREASRESDRTRDQLEDLGRQIERTGRTGRSIGDGVKGGTDVAKQELSELKDEAVQNLSETVSSFDGSFDSMVDGIQGTMGGIVSSLGLAGAAAGGALALGIGFAKAEGEELADAINTAKERAAELAAEIYAAGGDLSQIQWADKVKEWGLAIEDSREWFEFWQDDAKTALDVASEAADKFGLNLKDLALGLSGVDSAAATRSIEQLREQIEKLNAERQRSQQSSDREQISGEIRVREELVSKLEKQGNVTKEAAEQSSLLTQITNELAAADEAAAAAADARADATSSLQSELDEAVGAFQEFIDAETGAADPAGYIAAMQQRMTATTNFNSNVQTIADTFGLSQAETQAILDQGLDFAPMLQAIIAGGPEMQAQYATQLQTMVSGGQSILDGAPARVTVTADSQDAERALTATTNAKRTTQVAAKADTNAAERELNNIAAKKRTAEIAVSANTSAAERTIDNILNKHHSKTIYVDVVERTGRKIRW